MQRATNGFSLAFAVMAALATIARALAAPSSAATDAAKEAGALESGVRAAVYGLPLVLMDSTMTQATNVARRTRGFDAPPNQFANARAFPTAEFKGVVRASVDTLSSSAFLDVTKEPVVLSVPDTNGRYYVITAYTAPKTAWALPSTCRRRRFGNSKQ